MNKTTLQYFYFFLKIKYTEMGMFRNKERHDRKKKFSKVCTKKLSACDAELQTSTVKTLTAEEATFKKLNTEELIQDQISANKMTVGQVNVTGNTAQRTREIVSRDNHTGTVESDYLLVESDSELGNNLRVRNTCRIRKYTGPLDGDDIYDVEENFNLAKEIAYLRQELM